MVDWLQIYFIIGAAAGIIALIIMANDKIKRRPKIVPSCEIIYEDEKPKAIRFKATNLGRFTVTLNQAGFILTDGRIYYQRFGGSLKRIARPYSTYIYEHDTDFSEFKKLMKQENGAIKYTYFMGEDLKVYKGPIPDNLNDLIQS